MSSLDQRWLPRLAEVVPCEVDPPWLLGPPRACKMHMLIIRCRHIFVQYASKNANIVYHLPVPFKRRFGINGTNGNYRFSVPFTVAV